MNNFVKHRETSFSSSISIIFGLLLCVSSPTFGQAEDTIFTVFFDTNISELDSSQVRNIIDFTSSIRSVKQVIGYADSVGSIEFNRNLSRLRAVNTYKVLQQLNLDSDNKPSFVGEEFNQKLELQSNRKVEIIAQKLKNSSSLYNDQHNSVVETFDLENVYFVPDKPIITQESIPYVQELTRKLKTYREVHFEIIGHVNYQSKKDSEFLKDLFKLSEERAKVIYELLIENGMAPEKLKYQGVGNSKPIFKDPNNDEERKGNMRVQIVVIKSKSPSFN